jgi:hypothetical protein
MLPRRWGKRLKFHESTQRWLCRFSFILLGFLPTALIIGSWLVSITPWSIAMTQRAIQEEIGRTLGVKATLSRFAQVAPNHDRLHDVALYHPETGQLLARLHKIEFLRQLRTWKFIISQADIDSSQLTWLSQQLHERCLCQPSLGFPRIELVIDASRFVNESDSPERWRLELEFQGQAERSQSWLSFRSSRGSDAERGKLEIVRWHALESPTTQARLQTGGQTLRQELLGAIAPETKRLGEEWCFSGELDWLSDDQQWQVTINGHLDDVDWNRATSDSKQRLVGRGELYLSNTIFKQGRLVQAQGSMRLGQGKISRAWLEEAQSHLSLAVRRDALRPSIEMVPFDALQFGFSLNSLGLIVQGHIPDNDPRYARSLMAEASAGIVYAPETTTPIPLNQLERWLDYEALPSFDDPDVKTASHERLRLFDR